MVPWHAWAGEFTSALLLTRVRVAKVFAFAPPPQTRCRAQARQGTMPAPPSQELREFPWASIQRAFPPVGLTLAQILTPIYLAAGTITPEHTDAALRHRSSASFGTHPNAHKFQKEHSPGAPQ
jgi:hypothetical protein